MMHSGILKLFLLLSSVVTLIFLNDLCIYLTVTECSFADKIILMNSKSLHGVQWEAFSLFV